MRGACVDKYLGLHLGAKRSEEGCVGSKRGVKVCDRVCVDVA